LFSLLIFLKGPHNDVQPLNSNFLFLKAINVLIYTT
jgi:hypothetical protein